MRPPESFSTFSIHGLCIDSHTCDCGAMKVWNLSVTDCWARPDSAGAPRTAAAAPWRRERRFIVDSGGGLDRGKVAAKRRLRARVFT
jgi:hypothetical protein